MRRVLGDFGLELYYDETDNNFDLKVAGYLILTTRIDKEPIPANFKLSDEAVKLQNRYWGHVQKYLSLSKSQKDMVDPVEFIRKRDKSIQELEIEQYDKGVQADGFDVVKKPLHYNSGKYEVIDIIDSVVTALGLDPFPSYCMGNALKYICRAGLKGDFKEDIKKAIMYLTWAMGEDPRK